MARTRVRWGRTRSSAEIRQQADPLRASPGASMGPHSFECGNSPRDHGPVSRNVASMGPHSFECGNVTGSAVPWWGRWLQWGRTRSSAEMRSAPMCGSGCASSFNGAALVRVRKSVRCCRGRCRMKRLQWGRTRSSAEIEERQPGAGRHVLASMGPHSFECGNSWSGWNGGSGIWSFNGAALVRVRKST